MTRATITRLLTRYRLYGTVIDLRQSGRPRVTTARQDRHIRTSHLRNRFQTAVAVTGSKPPLQPLPNSWSDEQQNQCTVRNQLAERGIKCTRSYHGQVLTRRHRRERMNWVRQRQRWTRHQWNSILFTDAPRFCLQGIDRRSRVYRRGKERFSDACVREVDRFVGGSVMVWGDISFNSRTPLIIVNRNLTGQRYRDEILVPVVVPYFNVNRNVTIFQQDNA